LQQATKCETFTLRLGAAEKRVWDAVAKERGCKSLGAYVRRCVQADIDKPSRSIIVERASVRPSGGDVDRVKALANTLGTLSNNLNQIAARVHCVFRGKKHVVPPTADELMELVEELRALRNQAKLLVAAPSVRGRA